VLFPVDEGNRYLATFFVAENDFAVDQSVLISPMVIQIAEFMADFAGIPFREKAVPGGKAGASEKQKCQAYIDDLHSGTQILILCRRSEYAGLAQGFLERKWKQDQLKFAVRSSSSLLKQYRTKPEGYRK
jgi:hypothetical protein